MDDRNMLIKTYHLKPTHRAILVCIALIFCSGMIFSLFVLIKNHTSIARSIYDLFAAIICACVACLPLASLNNRIEISREGITLYNEGFQMYTPWDNITGVTRIWHPLIRRSMNVFTFKVPALLNTPIRYGKQEKLAVIEKRWGLFLYRPETYIWSLPLFADNLAHANISEHEIAIYIRQYAPQVFEKLLVNDVRYKQE